MEVREKVKASAKYKGKRGRKTKYKPEYCDQLIDHMASGLSFVTFAASIGVARSNVQEWLEEHTEFGEAKIIAETECQKAWETIGIQGTLGKLPGFNATAFIFNMKNRFRWTDRTDLSVSVDERVKDLEKHEQLKAVPRQELLKLVKKAM